MENKLKDLNIRKAEKKDCQSIVDLIKELAIYEKMGDCPQLTAQDLERDGFDTENPYFYCLVAEGIDPEDENGELKVVGYALYFHRYSTWLGKAIHLEDFYVTPKFRFCGIGSKIFRELAKIAVEGNYCRLTLEVLDWNEPSIKYYEKLNGINYTKKDGWLTFRFLPDALKKLADE